MGNGRRSLAEKMANWLSIKNEKTIYEPNCDSDGWLARRVRSICQPCLLRVLFYCSHFLLQIIWPSHFLWAQQIPVNHPTNIAVKETRTSFLLSGDQNYHVQNWRPPLVSLFEHWQHPRLQKGNLVKSVTTIKRYLHYYLIPRTASSTHDDN